MEDSQIADLCRKIYRKHEKALDLLYEYRPDRVSDITDFVEDTIKKVGPDYGFHYDSRTKDQCRFYHQSWENHRDQKKGKGWGAANRVLMFEFKVTEKKVSLHLIIGPGELEYRKEIFNSLQGQRGFSVRNKLSVKWMRVLAFNDFLEIRKENEEDEIKNSLEKNLAKFFAEEWPKITRSLADVYGSYSV